MSACVALRVEVLDRNAAGQVLVHILADNADGIQFWTDPGSLVRCDSSVLVFQMKNILDLTDIERIQRKLVRQRKMGVILIPGNIELVATSAPAAEIIVTNPKGQWIPKREDGSAVVDEVYGHVFACSICGHEAIGSTYEEECKLPFCSSCGAKMEAWMEQPEEVL